MGLLDIFKITTSNKLISRQFETEIGTIECCLFSDKTFIEQQKEINYENGNSKIFQTHGHSVELVEFKLRNPTYYGLSLLDSKGWLFRITKTNSQKEKITISCSLINPKPDIKYEGNSGEHYDCVSFENESKTLQMDIGSEDGEIMAARASREDWMPKQFADKLGFNFSFTEHIPYGLKTNLPSLLVDEKIYFHYLVAYDKYNEQNSTWFAADELKRNIESHVGL